MPKALDYHLNVQELHAIEAAIRHDKRPEVRQRCTAIRLLHLGHKPEQVAEMQAVSTTTIYSWFNRWQARNWRRKGGALANIDLWQALGAAVQPHSIEWHWVRGHAGDRRNQRVDRLAKRAIQMTKY